MRMKPDTVPALLGEGEFVINERAAKMIGYNNLEKLNNVHKMPKATDAIDEIIALDTINDARSMYAGGMVKEYDHGGLVNDRRNRKEVQGLGVEDKEGRAWSLFEGLEGFIQPAMNSQYTFPKQSRDLLDFQEEVSPLEALEAIETLIKSRNAGTLGMTAIPRVVERSNGGWGYNPNDPMQELGVQFADSGEQSEYMNLYGEFDPADFLKQQEDLMTSGNKALRDLSSQGAGALWQDPLAASRIRDTFATQSERALSGEVEAQIGDAMQYVAEAEASGADMEDFTNETGGAGGAGGGTNWNSQYGPPGSPNTMGTTMGQTMKGPDGLNYNWNGASWELIPGQTNPGDSYDEQSGSDMGGP